MVKKLLAILMVIALITVGFASCKSKSDSDTTDDKNYIQEEVILDYELIESKDASGTLQTDEKGLQIYDRYTFEDIDSDSVRLTAYEPLVIGSTVTVEGKEVISYIRSYAVHTVAIPETLGGKSVTVIGDAAFRTFTEISSLIIPSTVTTIGQYAFASCASLTGLTIPSGVTSIGEGAFNGCTKLATLAFETTSLQTIPMAAFMNCSALTSITTPSGLVTIERGAFYGCSAVTEVTVAEGVTTIAAQAFQGLTNLTTLSLPTTLTTVGELAFYGCEPTTINTTATAYFADPSAFAAAE